MLRKRRLDEDNIPCPRLKRIISENSSSFSLPSPAQKKKSQKKKSKRKPELCDAFNRLTVKTNKNKKEKVIHIKQEEQKSDNENNKKGVILTLLKNVNGENNTNDEKKTNNENNGNNENNENNENKTNQNVNLFKIKDAIQRLYPLLVSAPKHLTSNLDFEWESLLKPLLTNSWMPTTMEQIASSDGFEQFMKDLEISCALAETLVEEVTKWKHIIQQTRDSVMEIIDESNAQKRTTHQTYYT